MEMLLSGFRKLAEEGQDYREHLFEDFLVASNLAAFPLEMQEQGQFMQCPIL